MPNIFTKEIADNITERINHLTADSKPQWGTMNVAQMLAHCNVSYEMIYENIHPKPNPFLKFILKTLVKNKVVGEAPYPHNSRTAPQFIINESKNFETEKQRLIDYINKTQRLSGIVVYYD